MPGVSKGEIWLVDFGMVAKVRPALRRRLGVGVYGAMRYFAALPDNPDLTTLPRRQP